MVKATLTILCTTLFLTACGSSPIRIQAYGMGSIYDMECNGSYTSKYRPTDRECRHRGQPNVQTGSEAVVDRTSTWRDRPDILSWCRQYPDAQKYSKQCQGLPA
jgi:hypothetical protein